MVVRLTILIFQEMKLPSRDQAENESAKQPPKYGVANCVERDRGDTKRDGQTEASEEEDDDEDESGDQATLSKLKSKSQPDLSRIIDIDLETIEALMKDNMMLKEQLSNCYRKVARTKKVSSL